MYGVRGYDMEIITDSDKTFIYPTVSALGAVDKKMVRGKSGGKEKDIM